MPNRNAQDAILAKKYASAREINQWRFSILKRRWVCSHY